MFTVLLSVALAERFAILFAGTKGFDNYRYQADISAIYDQLIRRGLQKDHIIQFQYDDIANNPENLFPGKIFHTLEHKNIYPGNGIDFTGENVTTQGFYDSIRNLPSTPLDHLVIYYDGIGAAGFLSVPDGNGDFIYADDLSKVLSDAQSAGRWHRAIFGIETSYAGSVTEVFTAKEFLSITDANDAEDSSL
jgi:legumain